MGSGGVAVISDGRRYDWVIALRDMETIDFMTARWAHLSYELLVKVSNRIINELPDLSLNTLFLYLLSTEP